MAKPKTKKVGKPKKTKIIGLIGGPGAGKSTSAALLYAMLKQRGVNAELVREYVKDWAWEEREIGAYDQIYFVGKQVRRESLLFGKTDVVVSDSPVLMGIYYAQRFSPKHIADAVEASTLGFYKQAEEDGHEHINVLLQRTKKYMAAGRYQTKAQAVQIDVGLKGLLDSKGIPYRVCGTGPEDLEKLLEEVL